MSISLKLNHRIKLTSYKGTSLILKIDTTKISVFEAGSQELCSVLLKFVNEGGTYEYLAKQLTNKDLERAKKFIHNLEINNFIDYSIELKHNEVAVISPSTHKFLRLKNELQFSRIENGHYCLSRFTFFRWENCKITIENSLTPFIAYFSVDLFM